MLPEGLSLCRGHAAAGSFLGRATTRDPSVRSILGIIERREICGRRYFTPLLNSRHVKNREMECDQYLQVKLLRDNKRRVIKG